MTRCASCGYAAEDHEPDTKKCPVAVNCDCGRAAVEHVGLAPKCLCFPGWPHWCGVAMVGLEACPGQWSTNGWWRTRYAGDYLEPQPYDRTLWREIMARDAAARHAAADEARRSWEPAPIAAPLILARPPLDKSEFAAGNGKQAKGLGKLAVANGWKVEARYWRSGEGVDGCAVRLAKRPLRAVAVWNRKPGKSWVADVAYGWMLGGDRLPVKLSLTKLEGVIRGN